MIKRIVFFFILCLIAVSALAGYVLYDNARVIVRRQTVKIDQLPPAFEDFTILQISDLHSARFGRNQKCLVSLLDGLPYDMISINGDMVDRRTENPLPLLELLDNLANRSFMFYVTGNVGQDDLERRSGNRTPFGRMLEEHGVILLDRPHMMVRDDQHIWITDTYYKTRQADSWIDSIDRKLKIETQPDARAGLEADLKYQNELKQILVGISTDETVIGLTHIPFSPLQLDNPRADDYPVFDLVLAGHYHGGQIRIPFVRAIYLPQPSPDRFFPPEEIVSGFYQGKLTAQYISRGLGASSTVQNLNFRLFNPPEVTLITLTSADN